MTSDLRKHDITIRYIATEHPNIQSTRMPKEIAQSLFYDWWERRWGPEPEVLDITVDGKVFKSLEDTK